MRRILLVIPVLNEEIVLEENVRFLHAWCASHLASDQWTIEIADNGSTDTTCEIARHLSHELAHVRLRSIPERGRGRALSLAWSADVANVDILAYMDADLSTDLAALTPLLDAAARGNTVAYGSRFESDSSITRSVLREATSRGYRLLVRVALGIHARDLQCGFKAVSSDAWEHLRDVVAHPGWFWDTELLFWAEHRGVKTVAVPVTWVESRNVQRKSTVKLFQTIVDYLRDIARLRARAKRDGH